MSTRVGHLLLACLCCLGTHTAAAEPDYLRVVRAYADAMIQHGRDVYGKQHSPLFATTLDRKTLRLLEGEALARIKKIPRKGWGIRPHDRSVEGANPMHDQNLYQTLYGLTTLTGEKRYAAEADRALAWFFAHCQSPTTGLFAWGEHIGWNFSTEQRIKQHGRHGTHEFYRPWALWDRCFTLAPKPCEAFALGLWNHQIADHKTGDFSRHAAYDRHGPGRNSQYPRHGGFYIATWAAAYAHTKNPELLKAIACLVGGFEARRNPTTGALPAETAARSKGKMMWPPSNLSLAIDLWDGAAKVPDGLAAKMRACASRTDQILLKLDQDPTAPDKGFIKAADTDTLKPLGWPRDRGSYTHVWATGYGDYTHADCSLMCLERYQQVKIDGYRTLFIDAAKQYLTAEPNTRIALHPGVVGQVVLVMLRAHRLTGERRYLDRADHFGRLAVTLFFDDGPLPRATTKHDHYEAITRADTLAMALLDLWAAQNKPELKLGLVNAER